MRTMNNSVTLKFRGGVGGVSLSVLNPGTEGWEEKCVSGTGRAE